MQTVIDRNPATGKVLAEIPGATLREVQAAVSQARAAQPAWAALAPEARREALLAAAQTLAARKEELADTITQEMGKTRRSALGEVEGYLAGLERKTQEVVEAIAPQPFEGAEDEAVLVRAPHGVVAAITPWNFPVGMPLSILIPALGTGNAVVFKPSEEVPLTGAILHQALAQHLPDGVLTLLQGAGDVGAALVDSDVDMVGFVGSRATGSRIMAAASNHLKRMVLELGGKDPMIVFADADLEAAAECAVTHSLRNTGQVCCSVERVYVAEAVAERFEALVLEKARDWKHGDGFTESSRMGPLVSETQRNKVHQQVQEARAEGADVALGGELPEGPGYFYPATVLTNVRQDQRITQEETFGPVVALTRFSGEDEEGIRLANDTLYGLGANVWTGDEERGRRVAAALQAGQVGVNRYLAGAPGSPWVGARQSGFGFRGGPEGHRQFTTPKTISVARPSS